MKTDAIEKIRANVPAILRQCSQDALAELVEKTLTALEAEIAVKDGAIEKAYTVGMEAGYDLHIHEQNSKWDEVKREEWENARRCEDLAALTSPADRDET